MGKDRYSSGHNLIEYETQRVEEASRKLYEEIKIQLNAAQAGAPNPIDLNSIVSDAYDAYLKKYPDNNFYNDIKLETMIPALMQIHEPSSRKQKGEVTDITDFKKTDLHRALQEKQNNLDIQEKKKSTFKNPFV